MKRKLSEFFTSKYILIAVVVLCVLVMGISFFTDKLSAPFRNSVSSVGMSIQKGMNYSGLWTNEKYSQLQEVKRFLEENDELRSTVDSLTEENNRLKQDTYELERLRQLYELDAQYEEYPKVGARIIGTSSDNWYSTFTINKGSEDGLKVDMNVVASGGLVGIISSVDSHSATVKTIIEDGSFVSGQLIDTGDKCTVEGDIKLMDSGLISIKYFNSSVNVRNGDKIVTSNISDKYLSGILIGYTKDVSLDVNNLTQSGYLIPAVDFEHLQEVLIITELKDSGK